MTIDARSLPGKLPTPGKNHMNYTYDPEKVKRILKTGIETHDALFGTLSPDVLNNPSLGGILHSAWESAEQNNTTLCAVVAMSDPQLMGTNFFTVGLGPDDGIYKTEEEIKKLLWEYKKNTYRYKKKDVVFTKELDIIARCWEGLARYITENKDISVESDILAQIYRDSKVVLILFERLSLMDEGSVRFRGILPVVKEAVPEQEKKVEP